MGSFLAGPVGSAVRVFVSVVLGAFVLDLTNTGNISLDSWETWVVAGLVSALPVLVAYINPSDPRFGNGS
jgi:hypothetical protein